VYTVVKYKKYIEDSSSESPYYEEIRKKKQGPVPPIKIRATIMAGSKSRTTFPAAAAAASRC
jgi:hypothetical protein